MKRSTYYSLVLLTLFTFNATHSLVPLGPLAAKTAGTLVAVNRMTSKSLLTLLFAYTLQSVGSIEKERSITQNLKNAIANNPEQANTLLNKYIEKREAQYGTQEEDVNGIGMHTVITEIKSTALDTYHGAEKVVRDFLNSDVYKDTKKELLDKPLSFIETSFEQTVNSSLNTEIPHKTVVDDLSDQPETQNRTDISLSTAEQMLLQDK